MNCEFFVGLCLTVTDWNKYKKKLIESLFNLNKAFNGDCFLYIVIQGDTFDLIDSDFGTINVEVKYESLLGVSSARNLCIQKATDLNSKFILFHDASIYWTKEASEFICKNRDLTPKVNICFSDEIKELNVYSFDGKKSKVNPIYDTYVWSYLFKLKDIYSLQFNINFGPGQNTVYKSGEDALFLFDVFNKKKSYKVYKSNENVVIYHPPRDSDFSKHLLYAKGQGKIFRILLNKHFSLFLLKDVILFFGNAVFRCFLLRKNSFKILIQRVSGFFS